MNGDPRAGRLLNAVNAASVMGNMPLDNDGDIFNVWLRFVKFLIIAFVYF